MPVLCLTFYLPVALGRWKWVLGRASRQTAVMHSHVLAFFTLGSAEGKSVEFYKIYCMHSTWLIEVGEVPKFESEFIENC